MLSDNCPICRLPIGPTDGWRIPKHRDGIGHWCPLSGKEYQLVEVAASE